MNYMSNDQPSSENSKSVFSYDLFTCLFEAQEDQYHSFGMVSYKKATSETEQYYDCEAKIIYWENKKCCILTFVNITKTLEQHKLNER